MNCRVADDMATLTESKRHSQDDNEETGTRRMLLRVICCSNRDTQTETATDAHTQICTVGGHSALLAPVAW